MKRWVVVLLAILAIGLMVSGIIGCGAKLPTTTEYEDNDPQDTKTEIFTEVIENDEGNILAD